MKLKLHKNTLIWLGVFIYYTMAVILTKLYITENNISWPKALIIPVVFFVVVPCLLASLLIVSWRIDSWLTKRRKSKLKNKNSIRDARLRKVFVPHIARLVGIPFIFCILFSAVTAVSIRRQYAPRRDLSDDNITAILFVSIALISFIISLTVSSIIYIRLFISKKGKAKAVKHLAGAKKKLGILERLLFRAGGIDLSKYNKYTDGL